MATSFKAGDGAKISDGDKGTFSLRKGELTIEVKGTIRRFDHVERVYDEEHIAVGKTTEERWEIVTGDPAYPAVGILPENVLAKLS